MNQPKDQNGGNAATGAPADPATRIETMATEHKEISGTIRRTMLTLLGLELYCVVAAFGISDVELVVSNSKISMPISGAKMSATGFMIAAPLILTIILTYMHVFYGRLLLLNRRIGADDLLAGAVDTGKLIKAPSLFNLDALIPRILTSFIFYWSCPIVLAAITFTLATPFPRYFQPLIILTASVSAALLMVAYRRHSRIDREHWLGWQKILGFMGWCFSLGLIVLMSVTTFNAENYTRRLNLERIDLSGQILRDRVLPRANLRDSKLGNSDLSGADLQDADLRGTDLGKARLQGTNLSGADLTSANLKGADLTGADLSGAKLNRAVLDNAKLGKAILIGADLSRATLIRVDLSNADLTTAILSRANLYGAKLSGARLRGAALDAVQYLRQTQLQSARPTAPPTALPDNLTWPFAEVDGKWAMPQK